MRGVVATSIGAFAATAAAASFNTTCATGLYILCARGSGEPATMKGYPDYAGSSAVLAMAVAQQIKGSVVAGVVYNATDPFKSPDDDLSSLDLSLYYPSENGGAAAIISEVTQYTEACPDTKIAIIGYSQGAQVVRDGFCGGIGGQFNSDAPISPDLVHKNVVAITLMGDPTHKANEPINKGNATQVNGAFSRPNTTVCAQYDDFTASWCDIGDPFCAGGQSIAVHEGYLEKYGTDIGEYIIEKYMNATSQTGSGSGSGSTGTTGSAPTGTTGSNATMTGSATPSSMTSKVPNSASGLVVNGLALGGAIVLALLSLN